MAKELIHVHSVFLLLSDAFQHAIQKDEGASATDPGTAVDQERELCVFVVTLLRAADERDDGSGKLGNAVVWPGSEVELRHTQ